MNARLAVVSAMSLTVLLSACSSSVAKPPAPVVGVGTTSTAKGGGRQQAVTISATVEKVDLESRKVTMKGFDGTTETVKVADEVRNLGQVKKGDVVAITYYQSAAFEVLKPGEKKSAVTAAEGVARAQEGERPGGVAGTVITVIADIVKLDRGNQTAVLRGPEGNLTTVDVQNPANFDKVKVGDRVEITLTEAIAVDVQPAPER